MLNQIKKKKLSTISLITVIVNLFLVISLTNCGNKKNTIIYQYDKYKVNGKFINHQYNLTLKKEADSIYNATISIREYKIKFQTEHRNDFIKLIINNKSVILYSLRDQNIHYNIIKDSILSPYFVNNTKYLASKYYRIDNSKFKVSLFKTNNFSSSFGLVYYTTCFGFLCYEQQGYYQRVTNIQNDSFPNKEVLEKLINSITKDSTFFPCSTSYPKSSIKFYPPNI